MNWFRQPLSLLPLVALLVAPATAGTVTVTAVGDVMLAGSGAPTYLAFGYDYPFAATNRWLQEGDLTVGNLEAPLTNGGEEFRDKRFRFRVATKAADALQRAGFDVMTLANNHMLDYGPTGLMDTLQQLQRVGISWAGAGINLSKARKPAIVKVRDSRIAFLAYSLTFPTEFYATNHAPGTAPGDAALVEDDIRRA
ncbi:MAG TPA: CapA family protein, partial [Geobacterales bacterium]|nr:CapA family protein [Geobacterales bacterium]